MRFDAANLGKKNDLTKILAKENEDNGLSRDRHLPQAIESTFPVWIAAKKSQNLKSQRFKRFKGSKPKFERSHKVVKSSYNNT